MLGVTEGETQENTINAGQELYSNSCLALSGTRPVLLCIAFELRLTVFLETGNQSAQQLTPLKQRGCIAPRYSSNEAEPKRVPRGCGCVKDRVASCFHRVLSCVRTIALAPFSDDP